MLGHLATSATTFDFCRRTALRMSSCQCEQKSAGVAKALHGIEAASRGSASCINMLNSSITVSHDGRIKFYSPLGSARPSLSTNKRLSANRVNQLRLKTERFPNGYCIPIQLQMEQRTWTHFQIRHYTKNSRPKAVFILLSLTMILCGPNFVG